MIPTRNRLRLLSEAVGSAVHQTFRELEVIVVDDASSDGTWAWLCEQREPIRPVHLDEHSERSAARNRGLSEARGRYVLFLDDDDRLLPDAVDRLVAQLRRHPKADAAVGGYVMFDDAGNRVRVFHPKRVVERWVWPEVMFQWRATPGRTLFRTDRLRALGGYRVDLSFGEDLELLLRVSRSSRLLMIPDLVAEYRVHGGQAPATDDAAIVDELIAMHASTLEPSDKVYADRIQRMRRSHRAGLRALEDLDALSALRHLVGAIRTDPSLLRSPLARPQLVRPLGKSLVGLALGKKGTHAARKLKALGRRVFRREIDARASHSRPDENPAQHGGVR